MEHSAKGLANISHERQYSRLIPKKYEIGIGFVEIICLKDSLHFSSS